MYVQTVNLGATSQSIEVILLTSNAPLGPGIPAAALDKAVGNHLVIVQNVGTSPLYVGSQASLAEPPQSGRPHGLKVDAGKEFRVGLDHDQLWIVSPASDGTANLGVVL